MKLASEMLLVVARNPAAFTVPVGPITMPLRLMTQTLPFELSVPSKLVALPLTRFSVMEEGLGSLNCTVCPLEVLKPVQLTTLFGVVCVTVVCVEVLLIVAVPCDTDPPVGSADENAGDRVRARAVVRSRE